MKWNNIIMEGNYPRMLLVTANVGSIFEDVRININIIDRLVVKHLHSVKIKVMFCFYNIWHTVYVSSGQYVMKMTIRAADLRAIIITISLEIWTEIKTLSDFSSPNNNNILQGYFKNYGTSRKASQIAGLRKKNNSF